MKRVTIGFTKKNATALTGLCWRTSVPTQGNETVHFTCDANRLLLLKQASERFKLIKNVFTSISPNGVGRSKLAATSRDSSTSLLPRAIGDQFRRSSKSDR